MVVWVTRGALTPRKQLEHRAPIGQMPPNLTKVVLDVAILDRSVAVCGELGVPDQLRKIILKEYRLPADRYSQLKGQFEQACRSFKKAQRAVREGLGGKTKEGKLRAAATAQQERADHLLGQMRGPWEEAKKAASLRPPSPRCPPAPSPPLGNGR